MEEEWENFALEERAGGGILGEPVSIWAGRLWIVQGRGIGLLRRVLG